ncbi:MAG: hypothetical protein CMO01_06460 [Thalassobius sp.]|nr:hypothetical protein [Thalassovita sp.]
MKMKFKNGAITLLLFSLSLTFSAHAQRQMEKLNRGLVVVNQGDGNAFVSWRMLGTDPDGIAFNVYRKTGNAKPEKLNEAPLTESTSLVDNQVDFSKSNTWFVKPVLDGKEQKEAKGIEKPFTLKANTIAKGYFSIPLQTPENYRPNDASVGDLDGDGEYEIVLHQTGRAHDNSHKGYTDPPVLEAYELDGTLLWRINLGINIREGAHYTQFIVYDLDGDGKAEVACKTADGTIDGKGVTIGDPTADHRNKDGYILKGPEFLTVFDGETGAAITTTNFIPPRHPDTETPTTEQLKAIWGDGYGNRMDRFLAGVAYLDGKTPSLIMSRGYYTRSVIATWNFKNGELSNVWTFDSDDGNPEHKPFAGQGNHSLSVADVDNDGKDEIIFGAMTLDDDGTGMYSTGIGHGDALHVTDLNPERPGLEVFHIQERFDDEGANFRDALTGEILWKLPSVKAGEDGEGPGRGLAINIDPRYPGAECWVRGANIRGLYSATGEKISDKTPESCNFGIWWDGDLLREILDKNTISKWDWAKEKSDILLTAEGATSNNGTKSTPALSADLFGDWREELMLRSEDNRELRIYTTTIPTNHRFRTLMHDPVYRICIAWQNVAYNQPPHPSFYVGAEMEAPEKPEILIK